MRGPNPQSKFKQLGLGVLTVPYGGKTQEEQFHPGVDVANDITPRKYTEPPESTRQITLLTC